MMTQAEAPIVGMGLRRRWATTTATTMESEFPGMSAASEADPRHDKIFIVAVVPYVRTGSPSLPASAGRALMFEGSQEQVVTIEDAIGSSFVVPNFLAGPGWNSMLQHPHSRLRPAAFCEEEMLNWDAAIEAAPKRPSGSLAVTLKHSGRGTPTSVDNPWDD